MCDYAEYIRLMIECLTLDVHGILHGVEPPGIAGPGLVIVVCCLRPICCSQALLGKRHSEVDV